MKIFVGSLSEKSHTRAETRTHWRGRGCSRISSPFCLLILLHLLFVASFPYFSRIGHTEACRPSYNQVLGGEERLNGLSGLQMMRVCFKQL